MAISRRRRALLGLSVGVLFIVVMDIALRFLVPPERFTAAAPLFIENAESGFSLAPNLQFDGFTTNSLGMRGDEPRSDAVNKILVLGDSMTLGAEVKDTETFCYQWGLSVPKDTQILNAGCSAYGPVEELGALKRLGPVVRPKRVLLMFFPLNDIYDSAQASPPFKAIGGRLVAAENYNNSGAAGRFFKNLAARTWSFGYMRLIRKFTKPPAAEDPGGEPGLGGITHITVRALMDLDDYNKPFPPGAEIVGEGWKRLPNLITNIRRECDALGARLTIYILPIPFDYDLRLRERVAGTWGVAPGSIDAARPGRASAKLFESLGIETVDLAGEYARSGIGAQLHQKQDLHFSARGHAFTAELLTKIYR